MFEDLVVSSPNAKKSTSWWTLLLSTGLQLLLLFILILIPLIYTQALPKTMLATLIVAPPPPPPPPPPAAIAIVKIKPTAHLMESGRLVAPKAIPRDVRIFKEEEMPPDVGGFAGGVPGGVAGGQMGGAIGGMIGGMGGSAAPPKPQARIRQGGNVQAAKLVNKVTPLYPPLARQTRISGTVHLHAIIGRDGSVQQLEVLGGHPLLIQAALDAVRQWRYQPTLLNGEPVEVDTTIDVIFSLNQ